MTLQRTQKINIFMYYNGLSIHLLLTEKNSPKKLCNAVSCLNKKHSLKKKELSLQIICTLLVLPGNDHPLQNNLLVS